MGTRPVAYAFAFVGGPIGDRDLSGARLWGGVLVVTLVASSGWLVRRRPDLRAALIPWWFLALFGLANGLVMAYGRLDNGERTALLVRHVPTAGLFVAAVAAVATVALADVRARSRRVGVGLLACGLAIGAYAGYSYARAAWRGVGEMERLAMKLDQSTPCVLSCSAACLNGICWSGELARESCLVLERLGIGPFRPKRMPSPADTRRSDSRYGETRAVRVSTGAPCGLRASASACLPS